MVMKTYVEKVYSKSGCCGCYFFKYFVCTIPEEMNDYKCTSENKIWIKNKKSI